ncbi:hypothetical protein SLE2022_144080 [Rubroshorea leprosula]
MHGGATSAELGVYAYAAAQVKKAIEVTHYLELDHLARFLEVAVAYKKKIGFNGKLAMQYGPFYVHTSSLPI